MSRTPTTTASKNIFPSSESNRRVSGKQLHKTRLRNLEALIKDRFGGNAAQCAKAIDRSHTFLWQLVNKRRSIGETTARHIEECLGLGEFDLDRVDALVADTLIVARLGDGNTRHFQLVPQVELTASLKKVKSGMVLPCPIECSEDTVYVAVGTSSMEPKIMRGEFAFIDKQLTDVTDGGIYAITVKGVPEPVFRQANARDGGRGFVFVALKSDGDDEPIADTKVVKVLGRVIGAMRPM